MYTFLLPLAAVISTTVAASNYTLLNTWPGGFQAELCITNKMNVVCGWRVAIDFNPKLSVLDIWNVRRVDRIDMTKRKERYIVESFSYNQVLKKNEDLCLGFVARYSNNQMPNIRKLKGKFLYRCKVPTTPAPATTSAITSGTTTPLKASPTTPTTTPSETTSTPSDTTQSTSATTSGTTSTSQTTPTTSQITPTTSQTTPTTSQTTPTTSQTTPTTSQTTPTTSRTTPTTSQTTPATSQTTPTTLQTTSQSTTQAPQALCIAESTS
ncbi:cell wall protein DAN4-like [Haliotis rufescens]|uniref:cell wall protein DAN4-like n=1 Tax=Haliotis rufescens TaxID=6454 RepID=UPI00201EBD4C|nr:cell wall protein DAN4-like [Haliotis rufescens]